MNHYEEKALYELRSWQRSMAKKPSFANKMAKGMQQKMSSIIPEKAHEVITEAIKNMVKAVLFGSKFITDVPLLQGSLQYREGLVEEKIKYYKRTAALSGAGTGAGGIFLGLADFPILLSLKLKFLFDVATIYGFDVRDYKERLYILYVFQLAFSSQESRNVIYAKIQDWETKVQVMPTDVEAFDWRSFQQEYRDFIDLAKMLQLFPGIGAFVGAYANYKLMNSLGDTAMNAYRLRIMEIHMDEK